MITHSFIQQVRPPLWKILLINCWNGDGLFELFVPLAISRPLVGILPVKITVFVREIRADINLLRRNRLQARLRQHHTLGYLPFCDFRSNFRHSLGGRQPRSEGCVGIGVVEGSFEWKLLVFHGLDVPGDGFIPIDDPLVLVAEPLHFLKMPVSDQGSVIVADGRFSSLNVVSVKRPHK